MRKILLISLTVSTLLLWGCKEEKASFDVTISPESVSFRPIAGGAVMHYKLPGNNNVNSIHVRYQDAFGKEVHCAGSYAVDSLTLVGFNEARHGVKALVTIADRNDVESEPVEVSFDTKDSGPYAFFDNLEVSPTWGGFAVSYEVDEDARGMAHVLYAGKNPLTQEPDTLLLTSFAIMKGSNSMSFALQQESPTNDVVIRTEDFRGYMVRQEVWKDVAAYEKELFEYPNYDFEDPENFSIEDPTFKIGYKYLFDGNTKGHLFAAENDFNIYLAGPYVLDRTLFILDFRKPKLVASIRIYAMLFVKRKWEIIRRVYDDALRSYVRFFDMLPCHLTVYTSNDKITWTEIGSFEEDKRTPFASRWCLRVHELDSRYIINTADEYNAADPAYLEVMFPPTEAARYLKVVFHGLYERENGPSDNYDEYTTFQELEVYTAKD